MRYSIKTVLTLSSRRPKTAALDRTTFSMKLSMYVTKSSGMIVRSIFLRTRRAASASEPEQVSARVVSDEDPMPV